MRLEYLAGTKTPRVSATLKRRSVLWTASEDAVVRNLYPDFEAMSRKLRSRTAVAIHRRSEHLKLCRKNHKWTPEDCGRLRRLYPTASPEKLIAAFPGSTLMGIRGKARDLKIRKKRDLLATKYDVVTAVRTEARRQGFTMTELDMLVGSGGYFRSGSHPKSLNWAHVGRAVTRLGGVLSVEWPE